MIDVGKNPSDAVERALDLYGDNILRLAYTYMKTREDAEDVLQDVLLRFMRTDKVYESDEHMKAWLLLVTSNMCKDRLKSAHHSREVTMSEDYEVAATEENQTGQDDIIKHVMALPDRYRSVIHLYYYEEYSIKEIAGLLHIPEPTVRSRLKRGRDKLKNTLKGENDYAE